MTNQTKPCESLYQERKKNGMLGKTIKLSSYVVILCEINGAEVKAVRMDYYRTKNEAKAYAAEQYPDWKIKAVYRLYDEDYRK